MTFVKYPEPDTEWLRRWLWAYGTSEGVTKLWLKRKRAGMKAAIGKLIPIAKVFGPEHHMVLNADGTVIEQSVGTLTECSNTDVSKIMNGGAGLTDIHTHPDRVGPSGGDMQFYLNYSNIAEGIVVDRTYTYRVSRIPGVDQWALRRDGKVPNRYQDAFDALDGKEFNDYATAHPDFEVDDYVHYINAKLAPMYGFKYERRQHSAVTSISKEDEHTLAKIEFGVK